MQALMYSRFAVTREREEDTLQRRPLPHVVQFFGFQVVPMPALVTTLCQFSLVESQSEFLGGMRMVTTANGLLSPALRVLKVLLVHLPSPFLQTPSQTYYTVWES